MLVDHVEEHTIRDVLESGFWAGMTLYPVSKCTPERAVDMVEMYGPERLLVNSAGDWGPSKPTAVPDFILAMRLRGHPESLIRRDRLRKPARSSSARAAISSLRGRRPRSVQRRRRGFRLRRQRLRNRRRSLPQNIDFQFQISNLRFQISDLRMVPHASTVLRWL